MLNKQKSKKIDCYLYKILIIFIIGILLIPNMIMITSASENNIIEKFSCDKNRNKISDGLEKKIHLQNAQTTVKESLKLDLIINLDHKPTNKDISLVEFYGGDVHQTWDDLVYAMKVTLPEEKIYSYVRADNGIVLLQENSVVNTTLEYSTRQIQARPIVWENTNNVYPQEYRGNPDHSIAIIDTGIDDSHPDIADKIVAWIDFIGTYDDDSTADIYSTPTDRHGHGSHCAGIALGNGTSAEIKENPGKVNISFSDYFYLTEGSGWWNDYPIDTTDGAEFIDATLYWDYEIDGDEYYIWITDETETGIGYETGGTKPLECSTDEAVPAGIKNNYRAIFGTIDNEAGGDVDTFGTNYVGQIRTPMNDLNDDYNLLTGVAPECSLVGVKSLSDYGSGQESDVIDGMEWVNQNREIYQIRVASLSLGGAPGEIHPSEITTVNNLVDNGVVVVVSAGNSQQDDPPYVSSPALANKSIAVGSVNQNNEVTYYSSIGDPDNSYIKPDVVAPGGSYWSRDLITSIDSNDADHIYKSYLDQYFLDEQFIDDYQVMQGTSMAAPHVSGIAGLMAEAFENWDYDSNTYSLLTKMIICMTACETNMPGEDAKSPTLDRGGKDRIEGYGMVCADAAIEAITCNYIIGEIETEIFGDTPIDKKVWARQMELNTEEDVYYFQLDVPDESDYDLYIYSKEFETYGDPIILSSSTTDALGGFEIIEYSPTYDGIHYLVVKRVSGSGEFTLLSDNELPSLNQASVPVFSPVGIIMLISIIFSIGVIQIKRKK